MKDHKSTSLFKAGLIGLSFYLIVLIAIMVWATFCVFAGAMVSVSFLDWFGGVLLRYTQATDAGGNLFLVVSASLACAAGFVSAGCVEKQKLVAAFVFGIFHYILFFLVFGIFLYLYYALYLPGLDNAFDVADVLKKGIEPYRLAGYIALPLMGAFIESRLKTSLTKETMVKSCRKMMAHTSFLAGLFFISFFVITLILCPLPFSFALYKWVFFLAGFGVICMGYALLTIHQVSSLGKGLMKHPVAWFAAASMLVCNVSFIYRDRTNRTNFEYIQQAMDEMNGKFALPPGKNSAGLYKKARASLPEENEKAVSLALDANRQCTDPFFHNTLKVYDDASFSLDNPAIYRYRRLVDVLLTRAKHLAAEKKAKEALELMDCTFNLGTALRKNGQTGMIYCLVIRQAVHVCIRDIIRQGLLSPEGLNLIQEQLLKWERNRVSFRDALYNCKIMDVLEWSEVGCDPGVGLEKEDTPLISYFARHLWTKAFLRRKLQANWDRVLDQASFLDMYQKAKESSGGRIHFLLGGIPPEAETKGVLTSIIDTLMFPDIFEMLLNDLARHNLLKVFTAVHRFKLIEKRLPASWTDLAGEYLDNIPEDPYSGKPLGWRKRDKELTIFSIWKDEQDNKGEGLFAKQDLPEEERDGFDNDHKDLSVSIRLD